MESRHILKNSRGKKDIQKIAMLTKYDSFLISTDLEPDDMVAIEIMSKVIHDKQVVFLVGEGDAHIKTIRMKHYIEEFGFKNATILTGMDSRKKFPYDGYDVMSQNEVENLMNVDPDIKFLMKQLEVFIKERKPLIISIKPPRELIKLFKESKAFRDAISKVTIVGYMSFNIRCLMREYSKDDIVKFLKSFCKCYFFETHYAFERNENNITERDFKFEDHLSETTLKVMKLWNKFMVEDCQKTITEMTKRLNTKNSDEDRVKFEGRLRRNRKTLKQVSSGIQFVHADSGLILTLLTVNPPYRSASLKYDTKTAYPIVGEGYDIMLISPENKGEFRKLQIEHIKKILSK